MTRFMMVLFGALVLSSCAMPPQVPPAARSELAPTGKLRVGINYQNFLLVNKNPASGEYSGIAVDLGRELGRRLGVPVELVPFETAGKLADAVKAGAWDVAFLANEPVRANEIAFSSAPSAPRAPTTCTSPATCSAQNSCARRPSTLRTSFSSGTSSTRSPGSSPGSRRTRRSSPDRACSRGASRQCSNRSALRRDARPARSISASTPRT